jgi:hypothetical protein
MTDEVKNAIENAAKATGEAAKVEAKSLWQKVKDEAGSHPQFVYGMLMGILLGAIAMYLWPFKH